MKWSFLLFSSFLCLQAIAQYPTTGNKMRLGWQTTGDGLVYRGAIGDTATLDPSGLNNAWMLLDTVSGNLYAYRIKAWRLVSGGGGGVSMPFDSVTFNINEGDASEQELKYSAEKGYLQYGGLDSVQIPLLPGIWYVRNDTSVTIPKGTVVRASGTLGASGRIKVKHMIADGSIPAMYVLGIAMHDIASGADGYVMTQGKIRQLNTQAYSEGAVLYADVDTLGGLTQTEPGNGYLKLPIAFVVHSASNGTLAVRVSPGTYLRDLHDVYITSPDSSASLYYNTSESVWRDTTGAVLTSDTSVFARDFQISGTTNRLAMFTGSNTVGNSNIYQDSVGKIGIGINPSYKFQMFFNNSVTGFQDTLMDLYSANWYPVGVRSRVSNQIANGSYAVIGEALNGHYQENVGVYGIATKSDISGPGVNIGVKGEVSGTYNGLSTAAGATYGGLFINKVRKTLSSGNFNIGLRVITDSAGTYGIYQDGFGANYFQGNVGIGTASPARILHVNATSAIRIPVGTTADRGTSGNGDIRYNSTNTNFEWYSGSGWREPVNAARSPNTAGLTNRFSKFDANGLLDTSAILIQANNRIGIFNSPAAGDSALTVTGGIRTTTSIRTGSDAIINGIRVGRGGGNNANSIAIGANALATGSNANIAIGSNALQKNTTGFYNVALGFNALQDNTDQANLIAVGVNALQKNTTGYYNVAMGSFALSKNTSGNNNVAYGGQALENNLDGTYNAALGTQALQSNTSGAYNIAIGSEALKGNLTAQYNAAIGTQALFANTTGGNNFALGAFAFRNNVDGANNVIIGNEAGRYNTAGSNVTKLDNSILIGYDARPSAASGNTGEVVIGYQGRGNGSNTTTIGNSSTTATILPAGRLGIAITSPTARLHLPAGTATANTAPLKFTSGTNLTTPEAGAVEWNGTNVFVTNSSATRQTVNQGLTGSATLNFPSTTTLLSADLTITVTGAADGDVVSLGVPNDVVSANTCYTAWVSATNTVTIRFNNYSAGTVDPASGLFKVFVTKF